MDTPIYTAPAFKSVHDELDFYRNNMTHQMRIRAIKLMAKDKPNFNQQNVDRIAMFTKNLTKEDFDSIVNIYTKWNAHRWLEYEIKSRWDSYKEMQHNAGKTYEELYPHMITEEDQDA